ncbi:hypothetical protein [Pusillimonas sp. ANT_WB101]|uniref:DUF7370 family protein n=1 Tax=Pusillimonas sp. ANT_WB101 TaxID=2597356 RepID=UPI0011EFF2F4|nr:hypothetical protein [Pusillimonas sp. ANT_WB101]KAA0910680.1 hypothetical protein FQ179_02045 [Pusillimonas sp. ANT_WB101]
MTITVEQATEYLASVGVSLPDFILSAIVDQANSVQACLDEHYTPGVALLIQCYLLGLMGLSQGDRYVSSQTAPSGASQSFRYQSFADRWRGLMGLLRGLDTFGCAAALIPQDPTTVAHGGIWIGKGGNFACGGGR